MPYSCAWDMDGVKRLWRQTNHNMEERSYFWLLLITLFNAIFSSLTLLRKARRVGTSTVLLLAFFGIQLNLLVLLTTWSRVEEQSTPLHVMAPASLFVAIIGFMVWGIGNSNARHAAFMGQCMEDHKEYECIYMYRSGGSDLVPIYIPQGG